MIAATVGVPFWDTLNPEVQFICSALLILSMVWGVIWGGIRLWHKRQVKELAKEITPLLDKINDRMDAQDEVLRNVEHEVLLNNGSSIKDAVNRIENNQANTKETLEKTQTITNDTLDKMAKAITSIQIDQAEHLGVHKGMLMVKDA